MNTPDDSDIGYFIEADLRYPDNIKEKTKNFPFAPENKIIHKDKYNDNDYMKQIKPKTMQNLRNYYVIGQIKSFFVHYRMLKFYVRHGMVIDKIHEIIPFEQSNWLEKYINFNNQKQNNAKYDFEKDFYKLLNNTCYGKTMEKVRNRLGLKFFKKDEYKKFINYQSKLTFNGIHKSYENCDSYVFWKNEVFMVKPICLDLLY